LVGYVHALDWIHTRYVRFTVTFYAFSFTLRWLHTRWFPTLVTIWTFDLHTVTFTFTVLVRSRYSCYALVTGWTRVVVRTHYVYVCSLHVLHRTRCWLDFGLRFYALRYVTFYARDTHVWITFTVVTLVCCTPLFVTVGCYTGCLRLRYVYGSFLRC